MQNFQNAMSMNNRAFLRRFTIVTTVKYLVSVPYTAVDGHCGVNHLGWTQVFRLRIMMSSERMVSKKYLLLFD